MFSARGRARLLGATNLSETEDPSQTGGVASGLGAIDHVVVLMMENRSFDNVLGYLYPDGVPADAPLGRTFNGLLYADGSPKPLANPVPQDVVNPPPPGVTEIPASPVPPGQYRQPFPDPGEEYPHINTQLFNMIDGGNAPPYNLPPGDPQPNMLGFVKDYIQNFNQVEYPGVEPTYDQYRQIMQSYTPDHLPVLSTLAREFGVFDNWFAAVPSQTFCNRAFFHAGTSWGRVTNLPYDIWHEGSGAPTIFNHISACEGEGGLSWKVYSDNIHDKSQSSYSLTAFIHKQALAPFGDEQPYNPHYFTGFDDFLSDCAEGNLPSYSFLEPRFVNPHNDMHPSSTTGPIDGDNPHSSMTMGELLIWKAYDAIRRSNCEQGNNSQNTLLVITFDEHGGCYDHVSPPPAIPPDMSGDILQDGFDFKRLGLRVPTIMISAHIAANTVVNDQMDHCSFMNTMRRRWEMLAPGKFPPLTARVQAAGDFSQVFTASEPRPAIDWPDIPRPPDGPKPPVECDPQPANDLQRSCKEALRFLASRSAG